MPLSEKEMRTELCVSSREEWRSWLKINHDDVQYQLIKMPTRQAIVKNKPYPVFEVLFLQNPVDLTITSYFRMRLSDDKSLLKPTGDVT